MTAGPEHTTPADRSPAGAGSGGERTEPLGTRQPDGPAGGNPEVSEPREGAFGGAAGEAANAGPDPGAGSHDAGPVAEAQTSAADVDDRDAVDRGAQARGAVGEGTDGGGTSGTHGGAGAAGEPPGGCEGPPEGRRLAAAVAELDELRRLPVPEHVARYDALHGELSEALASIDEV